MADATLPGEPLSSPTELTGKQAGIVAEPSVCVKNDTFLAHQRHTPVCGNAPATCGVRPRRSEHRIPVPFHAHDRDAVLRCVVERLGEWTQAELAVVRDLPLAIVVVKEEREAGPRARL